ncbi:MAG: NAD(P)/FAD-dependent oxidoreductase [Lachnospiraceae bacterium]|nr:NAD(P)/FAD-dependent oxidoreductase [Lachnospiraceae bacterium]
MKNDYQSEQKERPSHAADLDRKTVVVIGAGPAGLTAGYKLLQANRNIHVVVLEESDCIGGISRTVVHNGNRMDIGGHRFFSKDPDVNAMWQELMPLQGKPSFDDIILSRSRPLALGGPDPEQTDRVMLTRNRVSRIYYKRHFFDYPIKMNMNTILNMGIITTFVAGISYFCAVLKKLPEHSLENFYINRFGRKLYAMFFEGYTEKLWGRHPRDISASWGAQRVKGLSIVAVIKDIFSKIIPAKLRNNKKVETSLIGEFHYPKYGPGQLWEMVASEIKSMGGEILLNHRAVQIRTQNGFVKEIVCETPGKKASFEADYMISSMPVKDLIGDMNDVPREISEIAAGLPYRDFVTIGILVDKINLRNETNLKTLNNIIPDCWIYVQDTGVKLGRIQIFNNWSPYMLQDPEHSLWIGLEYFCREGDEYWSLSEEEWKTFAVSELVKMGILDHDETIRDYHVEKVKKAYPAYFDTYDQMDKVTNYLDSFENLYCIGRNGQHRYNNMDHSMVTAFEAVKHLLAERPGNKRAIWNVNTEKEYHEEK